jgi:hypothetical protein
MMLPDAALKDKSGSNTWTISEAAWPDLSKAWYGTTIYPQICTKPQIFGRNNTAKLSAK